MTCKHGFDGFCPWCSNAQEAADTDAGFKMKLELQKGANAAQDERERKAADLLGMVHSCDWPDDVAEEVLSLRAQLAEVTAIRDSHRATLIKIGRSLAGVFLSDDVSDQFLSSISDEVGLQFAGLTAERDRLKKYEALYAEAHEEMCSCNKVDDPALYMECDWCARHPEGAEPPEVIQRMFAAESERDMLREALNRSVIALEALYPSKERIELEHKDEQRAIASLLDFARAALRGEKEEVAK